MFYGDWISKGKCSTVHVEIISEKRWWKIWDNGVVKITVYEDGGDSSSYWLSEGEEIQVCHSLKATIE